MLLLRTTPNKTHRIPASLSREAVGIAARVVASRDIVQRRGSSTRVEEGVEEAKRSLAGCRALVVQEGDDAREDRARARRAVDEPERAGDHNLDVLTLRGDVWEGPAGLVELTRVGAAECGKVAGDGGGLVGRLREDVREAAGGERRRSLGDAGGGADRGQAARRQR